ncbi:MAG: putative acetyltransferase EpsM [Chloroflexi bacterium ADurb.Bin360]|nr:MAG: putative acetyltransferase EpsM [Chloroflexi bacterium ADurb.Bin360]
MERKVAIYGAGGFAKEVAFLVEVCAQHGENLRPVCYVDDDTTHHHTFLHDLPVMSLEEARNQFPDALMAMGVGSPQVRARLVEKAARVGFDFVTLIHPGVERSKFVEIGLGTVICAGSILTVDIVLGQHVQVNLDCTIGHDVVMDDFATLAPGVHVSGFVRLGKCAYVGTGATIINGTPGEPLVIGDNVVVGAGACVTKSIPDGLVVVGVPARPLASK